MTNLKRIHLILRNAGIDSIYDVDDDYIEIQTDDGKFVLCGTLVLPESTLEEVYFLPDVLEDLKIPNI